MRRKAYKLLSLALVIILATTPNSTLVLGASLSENSSDVASDVKSDPDTDPDPGQDTSGDNNTAINTPEDSTEPAGDSADTQSGDGSSGTDGDDAGVGSDAGTDPVAVSEDAAVASSASHDTPVSDNTAVSDSGAVSANGAVSDNAAASEDLTDEDGEMVVGGYIEMPWDSDTPVVDDRLNFDDALDSIVNEGGPERSRYVSEPETVQSKFPDYDSEEEVLSYLKEKYPATRSQSPYGSCWAHSAMALSEFYLINHGLNDLEGPTGPETDYSELQMAYFCYNQAPNPVMGNTGDTVEYISAGGDNNSFLDYGGNLDFAAQSLMRYNGVAADSDAAAYSNSAQVIASGLPDEYASSRDMAHIKNEYQLNIKENPRIVKQAILENGIVGVSIFADDPYFNDVTNAYYDNVETSTNHAVAIVGWDDDYPVSNFRTDRRPSNPGAWLVRNSWSTNTRFAFYSYFWLSYEDTSISDTAYVFDMASPEEFHENNYYYDSELHDVISAPSDTVANVYTVQGSEGTAQETLKAVQLDATMRSNVGYTIRIYKNLRNVSYPDSGLEVTAARTSGTLPFAGRYTIDLASPVTLNQGEVYSVVVTTSGGRIDQEYSLDWKDREGNHVKMVTAANQGESFYRTDSGWNDISGRYNGNLCIRALTDNVGGATLPSSIESLSLRSKTESTATIGWSQANDVEGYEIWYSESENGTYNLAGSTTPGVRKFTHTGLEGGGTYYYKVYPVRNGVKSEPDVSPTISVTTLSATPELEIVSVGKYTAKVRWNKLTNGDGYEVRYRVTDSGTWYYQRLGMNQTECTVNHLAPNRECYAEIACYTIDSNGQYDYGDFRRKTFTTESGSGSAVTNLKAEPYNADTIKVSWDAPEEAWAYNVEQSTDGINFTTISERLGSTYNYYSDLDSNTLYYYRVTAIYQLPEGATATFVSGRVSSYTLLPGATGLGVNPNASGDALTVTWDAVTGANYYSIYRRRSTDDDYQPLAIVPATGQLSYEDSSVLPGRLYYYRVFPCRTNELTDTQGATLGGWGTSLPLAHVTDLECTGVTSRTADLAWSAIYGAEGYKIEMYDYTSQEWIDKGQIGPDQLTYTLTGLSPNTRYGASVAPFTNESNGRCDQYVYFTTANKDTPPKSIFTVTTPNATYDGTSHGATVTSSDDGINAAGITVCYGKVTGTTVGTYSTTAPVYAGTYQIKIKTRATTDYLEADLTDPQWRFTISKREVQVSGITAFDRVYNGNTTAPLITRDAVFTGVIDGESLKISATGTFEDKDAGVGKRVSISDLRLSDARGNTPLNYTLASTGNQTETTASITPKDLHVAADSKSKTYGDADPALTYTVTADDLVSGETTSVVTGNLTRAPGENVGIYAISQGSLSAGSNYNIQFTTSTLSIGVKTVSSPTITLSPVSYTYTGSACEPTVTVRDGSTVIPASEYTVSYSSNTGVGQATVYVTDRAGGNYKVNGSTTFTIAKAASSVTLAPAAISSLTYDGTSKTLISAGTASGGTMKYRLGTTGSYSESIPTASDAGDYTVYYKVFGDGNHEDTAAGSVDVSIAKAAYTGSTATAGSAKYDRSGEVDLASLITSGGSLKADSVSVSDTDSILSGAPTVSGTKLSYAFINDSSKKDKTATVTVDVNGGANYEDYTVTITLTVLDKQPQVLAFTGVTGGAVTKSYGDADFTLAATLTSGNGPASYSSSNETVATVNSQGKVHILKNTGSTVITATAAATDDYAEGSASYNLTVTQKKIRISGIKAANKTYDGGTSATLDYSTATLDGIVTGDNLSVSATGTFASPDSGSNITVNISGLTLSGDDVAYYELASTGQQTTAKANIRPKPLTVTWSNTSFTYDGTRKTPTAVATGFIGTDTGTVTVIGGQVDAGTYTATASGMSGTSVIANYYISPSGNTTGFTIAKVPSSVTAAPTAKSGLVYNGKTLALVNAGTPAGGTMQYALGNETRATGIYSASIPTAVNAGSYHIYYKVKGDKNHNDTESASRIDVTIGKASRTATAPASAISAPYTSTKVSMVSLPSGWNWSSQDAGKSLAVNTPLVARAQYTASDRNNYQDASLVQNVTITRQDVVHVTGVALNRSSGSVNIGSTMALTATVIPNNAANKSVTWKSSNTGVATVTSTGVVKGVKAGSAVITVTTVDGGKTATCSVTVINPVVPVSGVTLNKTALSLVEGQSSTLAATVSPSNATDKSVTYTSSNPAVATVNTKGAVTAVKRGKAVITVRTKSGAKAAKCTVTVDPKDKVQAFVTRLYRVVLEREPDDGGLGYWEVELKSGRQTGADVVSGFYLSDEMRNKGLSNSRFVELAYNGIMGRAPDGGKAYWTEGLDAGASYDYVASGFIASQEFTDLCASYGIKRGDRTPSEARDRNIGVTEYVSRLYTKCLGRGYDSNGLNYWCQCILDDPSRDNVIEVAATGFFHSEEFVSKNLSNDEYIKVCYRTFLGREAEGAGFQYWKDLLDSGEKTRDDLIRDFAYSEEFNGIMASYGL